MEFLKQFKNRMNYRLFSQYRTALMGIAALLIVFLHSSSTMENMSRKTFFALSFCSIGVEIFLLVSGIGLYFAWSKHPKFGAYFMKRVLNVYVMFLIIGFPMHLYYTVSHHRDFFYFLRNWTGACFLMGKSLLGWYVVFIMILYAVYPALFKLQKWLERKKCDLLFVAVFTCLFIAGCYFLSIRFKKQFDFYEIALERIPVFVIGSYLGKLIYQKKKFSAFTVFVIIAGIAVYVGLSLHPIRYIDNRFWLLLLTVSLCLIICIVLAFFSQLKWEFPNRVLSFLGNMSLELYLTHSTAYRLCFKKGHCENLVEYAVLVGICIIISYFLSLLRQQIMKKYKEKHPS